MCLVFSPVPLGKRRHLKIEGDWMGTQTNLCDANIYCYFVIRWIKSKGDQMV